ncbi:MAG: phospho-sugar mutase [Omnitrophica WOR_2 bacterium]
MTTKTVEPQILEKAKQWLLNDYDEETRMKVQHMIQFDETELIDSFYRDLEFGTGGLRGIMGAGTNRMNKYTVGSATQGLANYLNKSFKDNSAISVAIAFDSRNNSQYFAKVAAGVLSANGIKVFLFESLRPTPELSYAVRYLKCQAGIVITASHNPKEYNGYKVYWDDGGQLVPPHDEGVITEVKKITTIKDVKFEGQEKNIKIISKEVDEPYLKAVKSLSLNPDIIQKQKDLKIVYTAIHGTGTVLVPASLKNFGFTNVSTVEKQMIPDGNFPTVASPNPEEKTTMSMALDQAKEIGADLILATDPDADRVGVGVKDDKGNYILLNGNQSASLLIYYLITQWKKRGKITGHEYIVKTIVTSELLRDIAHDNNVECFDVLTGFKYIAEKIREYEGKKTFIGGGEESYGYLVGDFVRDKDAVISCSMLAETAAWAKEQGLTMFELLVDIYTKYGFYLEELVSLTKKGQTGAEEIQKMMDDYREKHPEEINGQKVIAVKDYLKQIEKNLITGKQYPIELPKSDVLQFFLEGGSKITVRPSGTEPKIKFYFGVKGTLSNKDQYYNVNNAMRSNLEAMINALSLK